MEKLRQIALAAALAAVLGLALAGGAGAHHRDDNPHDQANSPQADQPVQANGTTIYGTPGEDRRAQPHTDVYGTGEPISRDQYAQCTGALAVNSSPPQASGDNVADQPFDRAGSIRGDVCTAT